MTALFTKPPAEPFPALPCTIPENAVKPSIGKERSLRLIPTADRTVDGGFVNSAVNGNGCGMYCGK